MKNVTYINAGAGSGKTYTLTTLLAEELSKNKVNPSQVILTTFTELAAAEFREKAREQILASKAENKLETAAQIDGAVIGTVHSMAFHFIRKFWYLLDYGADIQPISERDDDFYMSQSLARIVQKRDVGGNLVHGQHLKNFQNFRDHFNIMDGSRPDYLFWQPILRSMVEKMEYYEVSDIKESINKSVDTLKDVFSGPALGLNLKDEIVVYLKKYNAILQKETSDTAKRQSQEISSLLNDFDFNAVTGLGMVKNPVKPAKIESLCPGYDDFKNKVNGIPTSVSHLDILIPFVTSIFELAEVWRDDFKTYKQNNHIISYNDMEQLFLWLITEKDEVKEYIKEHYRLVMVDEFQDSNPIQLKIFNQLSELVGDNGDGRSYWVGDPKQSIYGFRGADTELINEVSKQKEFIFYNDDKWHVEPNGFGTKRLTHSWRSRAKLVRLVNDTFLKPFMADGIEEKLITLEPHFASDDPDVSYNPLIHWECKEGNKENAAAALADKVKELLASDLKVHHDKLDKPVSGIQPYDVAILCRKNTDAKEIVKALRKKGVAVSEPEDAIMQRVEVQLVVTLLQYMQNPTNKHVRADLLRLLEGMRTEEILIHRINYLQELAEKNPGISDEDLKKKDDWLNSDVLFKNLDALTERFQHLSIPEMVDGLIYECDIPALANSWGDGAIRRQNLSTLRKLAADYDQRCLQMGLGASVTGFIYFLNSTEPDKSPDNHSNSVKVLTYHGSKGLEWSTVILSSLSNDALDDAECIKKSFMRVLEVDKKTTSGDPFHKDYYLHFFPYTLKNHSYTTKPAEGLIEKIKGLPSLYTDIQKKVQSEERRLMYVGMTRAKDRLITFGIGGKSKADGTPSSTQINEFNWLKNIGITNPTPRNVWDNTSYCHEYEEIEKNTTAATSTASPTWEKVMKPVEHTGFDKRYLSPSKIADFNGLKYTNFKVWEDGIKRISTKGWGDDYATIGSCIHDFFAVFKPGDDKFNEAMAQRVIDGYGLKYKLTSSIGDIIQSAEWLYEQLRKEFPQTAPDDGVKREVPFQLTMDGQTLRGEMDLLWFYTDEEGQHCVLIDYKSFPGVDYSAHTQKHYAQLSAYAHALREAGIDVTHTLIYYPVGRVVYELLNTTSSPA
jgi:ATP-dependent exoDNAse (exonuclease V) beta subunit